MGAVELTALVQIPGGACDETCLGSTQVNDCLGLSAESVEELLNGLAKGIVAGRKDWR